MHGIKKMKILIWTLLLMASYSAFAEDAKPEEAKKSEWQNTSLSEETIKKIQMAKYEYNKCVMEEMKKSDYVKVDSRHATDSIIKSCESVLADMREVYLDQEVPEVVADRHLKQMRIQTTRAVLQQLMFNDAARKASGK